MKSSPVPIICGTALAAISAAGVSHWWSVAQFVASVEAGLPVASPEKPVEIPKTKPAEPVLVKIPKTAVATSTEPDATQKNFYEALIKKMENLQNQNRDLLDQVAETNRDVMKLEFRVDTHSESFRPMPVSEDRNDTSFDDSPGVLPPRAEPVPSIR